MLNIILSLLIAYMIYWCLENSGYRLAAIVAIVIQFVSGMVTNHGQYFLYVLISSIIAGIINTAIDYWIYRRTNSFLSYILLSMLLGIVVAMAFSFIITLFMLNAF